MHHRFLHRFLLVGLLLLLGLTAVGCALPAAPPAPAAEPPLAEGEQIDLLDVSWDQVEAQAEGRTVNWVLWGGSELINRHVDEMIGGTLREQHGITLNRVPVENTADAVNKVLNEKAAGLDSGGSIDLIWINGENFRTLKDADLLFGPFAQVLPNAQAYVDWENPAVSFDFGVPTDGYESPWASFQWVVEYNSANVPEPPTSYAALRAWVQQNPGRFTYPAPPNHVGSGFVRQLFYWAAGNVTLFLGEFDQAVFDEVAPVVWDYLNAIEPFLWRQGQTYPELAAMADLLANQEIDFAMEYDSSRASSYIRQGIYPDTIRTYVFDSGTVANVSYVAIPYNAGNPAAAMVLANYLLSPQYQIAITDPDVLGWKMAIDPTRLGDEQHTELAQTPTGVATLPADTLAAAALPEMSADWVRAIEQGWEQNVLQR